MTARRPQRFRDAGGSLSLTASSWAEAPSWLRMTVAESCIPSIRLLTAKARYA
jgi:hypothetical protein